MVNQSAVLINQKFFSRASNSWISNPHLTTLNTLLRKNQVTGEQICRNESELYRTADAFRVYLESSRRRDSIQNEFSGKERTTEEAANIVGLTTPDRVMVGWSMMMALLPTPMCSGQPAPLISCPSPALLSLFSIRRHSKKVKTASSMSSVLWLSIHRLLRTVLSSIHSKLFRYAIIRRMKQSGDNNSMARHFIKDRSSCNVISSVSRCMWNLTGYLFSPIVFWLFVVLRADLYFELLTL